MCTRPMYLFEKVKKSCQIGVPSVRRISPLLEIPTNEYQSSDFAFLEKYLNEGYPESLRIVVLKVLCRFGNSISKYLDKVQNVSSHMDGEIIKIAEKQNNPDVIIDIASENKANVNAAILALKRIGKTEYLASFLFSENEDLVNLVKGLEL